MQQDRYKTILVIVIGLLVIAWITRIPWFTYSAMTMGVLAIFIPSAARAIEWLWLKLALALGWVNSRILLSVIYFIFLLPIAWVSRLFTKDPLLLRRRKTASLFVTRNHLYTKKDSGEHLVNMNQAAENKSSLVSSMLVNGVTGKVEVVTPFKSIVKLIRVRHWVKNLFLFIPSFFAGHLFKTNELLSLLIGTLAFSFVASGVYIMNDFKDRHLDKLHPKKRLRPLASGEVKLHTALILMTLLIVSGLFIAGFLNIVFLYLLLAYLGLNIGYSFGWKNIPILDLFIVASGFLIRIYSGGVIAGLPITHWLSLMILLLALFLILAKRRDDILLNNKNGHVIRKSSYNLVYINSCVTLLSAVMIVAYIMYTVSPEVTQRFQSDYIFITTVFVIAGIMRYLQIVFVEQNSGSPTNIFIRDKFIIFTVIGWILSFYFIIYASKG